ncbi:hypothetical protein SAMN02799624_05407 [Paenibacillus sp. UNC496MF]|uniref:hypothetical protein n=1 Tax=Paenibacillus sp. UNC496MF TaxID=1502753 RepID=UPI0008ED5BA3|nr:hypothetical protein [Paenibacillus sp. UNC496MF]SFJ65612.1 hypothetical protein SAMN02799624_05407 [Paenibacillus sp. UNC496MF]
MEEQIYQLAEWFVFQAVQAIGTDEAMLARLQRATASIRKATEAGWTIHDLQFEISEFARIHPELVKRVYHLEEIIGNKKPPNNLIEPDVFYYHNVLRNVPPAPRISIKDGVVKRIEESFYLEIKKRFTMDELQEYWYKTNGITPNDHMRRQDEGKFKYLLGIYNIDELLFAIDVARSMRAEMQLLPLRNAFDLERYMDDARKFIEGKKNVHIQEGINKIVRKEE